MSGYKVESKWLVMTAEEYNQRLTELYGLVSGDLAADVIAAPAAELLLSIKRRIGQGKNTSDSSIGNYSVKPLYASKNTFVKPGAFSPQGKKGIIGDRLVPTIRLKKTGVKKNPVNYKSYSLVKPNYQVRKTMYLKEGYKELRDIQSLRTDIVNVRYRGDLLNDYQMAKDAQAYLLGFSTELQSKKRKGLEKRFGARIFYATASEIEAYDERVNFNLRRLTVNTLEGKPYSSVEFVL